MDRLYRASSPFVLIYDGLMRPDILSYTDTGLITGKTYQYAVEAINFAFVSNQNIISVTVGTVHAKKKIALRLKHLSLPWQWKKLKYNNYHLAIKIIRDVRH